MQVSRGWLLPDQWQYTAAALLSEQQIHTQPKTGGIAEGTGQGGAAAEGLAKSQPAETIYSSSPAQWAVTTKGAPTGMRCS